MKLKVCAVLFYTAMALLLTGWLFLYLKQPEPTPVAPAVSALADKLGSAASAVEALKKDGDETKPYYKYLSTLTESALVPKFSLNRVDFPSGGSVSDGYQNLRDYRLVGRTAEGTVFYIDLSENAGKFSVSSVAEDAYSAPVLDNNCIALFLSGQNLYGADKADLIFPASRWAGEITTGENGMPLKDFNLALIDHARQADFLFGHILTPGGLVRTGFYIGVLALGTVALFGWRLGQKKKKNRRAKNNVIYWQ